MIGERIGNQVVERFVGRGFNAIVDLQVPDGFEDRFRQLIVGGVPVVYANHQSHADGIAMAVVSEYLRNLAAKTPGSYPLRGFAVPIAASMASGDQSIELKQSFDILKGTARSKGVEPISVTRKKDAILYGMSRQALGKEALPFRDRLLKGFGIGSFPEASVQGGRHPEGAGIDEIYGMQEVVESDLIDIIQLANRVLGREGVRPFFIPLGLHGSYRFMDCPEGGKSKPTLEGWATLIKGMVGLPVGMKMQARLAMPFTGEQLVQGVGEDWMENVLASNRHFMEQVAPAIPPVARGAYSLAT